MAKFPNFPIYHRYWATPYEAYTHRKLDDCEIYTGRNEHEVVKCIRDTYEKRGIRAVVQIRRIWELS